MVYCTSFFFFFQAEDGIRDLVRSRGLGDVYKRQARDRRATTDQLSAKLEVNHQRQITRQEGEVLSVSPNL